MHDLMTDPPLWRRNEPDSPCVNVCQIHPDKGICIGCYRTAAEISSWRTMEPATRHALLAALPARGAALQKRRGGRRARLAAEGD